MSEHDHQAAVIKWFDNQYPSDCHLLMAYPSGAIMGGKNKWGLINKMKKEGWRKGVPDLFLAIPNDEYHGLFIEMKDNKKSCKPSAEQTKFIADLESKGYRAEVCWGSDQAIDLIKQYLIALP